MSWFVVFIVPVCFCLLVFWQWAVLASKFLTFNVLEAFFEQQITWLILGSRCRLKRSTKPFLVQRLSTKPWKCLKTWKKNRTEYFDIYVYTYPYNECNIWKHYSIWLLYKWMEMVLCLKWQPGCWQGGTVHKCISHRSCHVCSLIIINLRKSIYWVRMASIVIKSYCSVFFPDKP